jgi:hypothetical protein
MILLALLRGVVWQGLLYLAGQVPASPFQRIRAGELALVLLLFLVCTPRHHRRAE